MLPKGFKLSSRLWLSSLGVVSTCMLLVYALLGRSILRGDNHVRYYSDVLVCNGTSQERSYENSTCNTHLHLTSDMMINLTVDTPDPKLIGKGKDLFQPFLKRVVNFQNNIVLFSAVAGNSSSKHIWDTIDIQGWEHKSFSNNTYKCCVRYTSGALRMVPATRIRWTNWVSKMNAVQFVCSNLTSRTGDLPDVATIATRTMECHNLYDWYLPVTFAHAHKNEIAVCSKIQQEILKLNIDTPDPKLIGDGKHLFEPILKKVRNFDRNIVLFSAVAGNSSSEHIWDTLYVQGWENIQLINNTYKCCVRYTSGAVRSVLASRIRWTNWVTEMNAMQFVCSNLTSRTAELPEVATLTDRKMECHNLYDWYLPVTFAHVHKNEIAVCSKIVYGSVAADDLLSWFELHRRLGVTKVLVYTHKLNPQATRVLQYYRALGMADTVPFEFLADDNKHPEIGVKNYQAWQDEQVPVFDCMARLRGYRYLALVDTDEYLMSNRGLMWMNMLDDFLNKYPAAAGFNFHVKVHVTSWNKTSTSSQFKVGQYVNSTRPITDRWKHVTMPDRLAPGGYHTHKFTPNLNAGFKRHVVSADDAVIHHFRSCRKEWLQGNCSCYQCEQSTDDTVAKLFDKIEPEVLKLRAKIFDSD